MNGIGNTIEGDIVDAAVKKDKSEVFKKDGNFRWENSQWFL